jgi:hypothetical protein
MPRVRFPKIGAVSNGAIVTITVRNAELNMGSSDIVAAIPPRRTLNRPPHLRLPR